MTCNQNCQQGRSCDCEQLDAQPTPFEMIGDFVVSGLIAVGVIACVALSVFIAVKVLA